jgi:hypothetical protein
MDMATPQERRDQISVPVDANLRADVSIKSVAAPEAAPIGLVDYAGRCVGLRRG